MASTICKTLGIDALFSTISPTFLPSRVTILGALDGPDSGR